MPDEQIAALERRQAHLRGQLALIGEMRSGSLTERCRRCGKAQCRCARVGDSGRGPVLSLTRKRSGKTATRIIPAHAAAEIRAEVAEYRRFRRLSKELIEVSDALSEARLTAGREGGAEAVSAEAVSAEAVSAEAVKKGASRKRSRPRSAPRSTRC